MALFGAAHGCGGPKMPLSLKSVVHNHNPEHETWHSYTLPKEDPKNIKIAWHILQVLLTSAFFHQKSANFAISRNTDIDYILIHSF